MRSAVLQASWRMCSTGPRHAIPIPKARGTERTRTATAREQQIVAKYTDALAALLAEETGDAPGDIRPRLAAEAMMAFHRSLIDFARRRALSRQSSVAFALEIRAAGEQALTILESGLGEYGRRAAPRSSRDNP